MSDERPINSRINPALSQEQYGLFRELLGAIELRNVQLHSASYRRLPSKFEEGKANNLNFQISQRIDKKDPKLLNDMAFFNPAYDFEIILNNEKAMELHYHYGLAFQILTAKQFENAILDEGVKLFFIEKQLAHITWTFLREEIHSAMGKCGMPAVPLPLLR